MHRPERQHGRSDFGAPEPRSEPLSFRDMIDGQPVGIAIELERRFQHGESRLVDAQRALERVFRQDPAGNCHPFG